MNLDKKQREVVDTVMGGSVNSIYLTGQAGSGKSKIIKQIAKEGELENRRVILLAPTNAAAKNIGGITYFSAFGLNVSVNEDAVKENEVHQVLIDKKKLNTAFSELNLSPSDIMIVDEVSMGGKRLAQVFKLLRTFEKERGKGLCTLMFVGDPYQLPPVKDTVQDWGKLCNVTFSLTKNYRADNPELREILSHYRDTRDDSIITQLPRVKSIKELTYDPQTTYIAYKNKTLAKLQHHLLGPIRRWVEYGDAVTAFGSTPDHMVEVNDMRTNRTKKVPYFTTGSVLEVVGVPKPFLHYEGLFVVEVENPEYDGKPILDKNEKYPVHEIEILTGDYKVYTDLLEKLFHEVTVFKRKLFKKYNVHEVKELKYKFNQDEAIEWSYLWKQYFVVKNRPFARHSSFITAHKAQGQSLEDVVVMWDEMEDDKLRYVAISRAVSGLTLVTKK